MTIKTLWPADETERDLLAGPIGAAFQSDANEWFIQWTGGGCRAWATATVDRCAEVWICDLGNGLGDTVDEGHLVGLHPYLEWNDHFGTECATLAEAIQTANLILATRAFAAGFQPLLSPVNAIGYVLDTVPGITITSAERGDFGDLPYVLVEYLKNGDATSRRYMHNVWIEGGEA